MHEVAEYGKAAHWTYKEKPVGATLEDHITPENISPGHPILRISPSGKLRDAVVISSENAGKRLLVAVSHSQKVLDSKGPLAAAPKVYGDLFDYVSSRGYFSASQGDMKTTLELFTLCSDEKYHRLDRFGHKLPTTAVPLQPVQPVAELEAAAESNASRSDKEAIFMNSRIKLLRSMIEWGVDVEESEMYEDSQVPDLSHEEERDIMVLVWPSGKIMRLPRGTTAGDVMISHNLSIDCDCPVPSVNVNNKMVNESTILEDGDYIVLTNESVRV